MLTEKKKKILTRQCLLNIDQLGMILKKKYVNPTFQNQL